MRKIVAILTTVLLFGSCQKEIKTYDWTDMVYFDVKSNRVPIDTTNYSFAFDEPEIGKILIPIRIQMTGELKDYDRKIELEIVYSDPEVIKGTHFDVDLDTCYIRRNTTYQDINIQVNRLPDMLTRSYRIGLRLKDNQYFKLTNKRHITDPVNNTSVDLLTHTVVFSEIIQRPEFTWFEPDDYFGEFSVKKFLLICEVTGYDRKVFTDPKFMATGRKNYIKSTMNQYFDEYKKLHTDDPIALDKIKEENGSFMEMGK